MFPRDLPSSPTPTRPLSYIELHCHSVFSLLDGASEPEALVACAKALGMPALALTDHDDLGGVVRFAQAAQEMKVGGILGCELSLDVGGRATHLILLAQDRTGYGNISSLITRGRMDNVRGEPRVSLETLATHTAGLFALTGCPRGWVPSLVAEGRFDEAREAAATLRDMFDGRLAIEVWDHHLPQEREIVHGLLPIARALDLPWVVTNDVHYAEPSGRLVHDVLSSLRNQRTLDEMGTRLRPNGEWHLKSAAQLRRRWKGDNAGLRATLAIGEQCPFRLEHLKPEFPTFPVPPGVSADEYLALLVEQGARERCRRAAGQSPEWSPAASPAGPPILSPNELSRPFSLDDLPPEYGRQIQHELEMIRKLELAGFFLIVWDIVRFASRAGVLCQGRGSAANSAVCYCLGITAVDPVRHNLLFERFLSDGRKEPPDIDLDFAHRDREKVLQYVYDRYGREHAAMVCEQITYRGRSAVRDAARVLGFSVEQADVLSALSDRFSAKATADALRAGTAAAKMVGKEYDLDPRNDRPGVPDDPRKQRDAWSAEQLLAERFGQDLMRGTEVATRRRADKEDGRRVALGNAVPGNAALDSATFDSAALGSVSAGSVSASGIGSTTGGDVAPGMPASERRLAGVPDASHDDADAPDSTPSDPPDGELLGRDARGGDAPGGDAPGGSALGNTSRQALGAHPAAVDSSESVGTTPGSGATRARAAAAWTAEDARSAETVEAAHTARRSAAAKSGRPELGKRKAYRTWEPAPLPDASDRPLTASDRPRPKAAYEPYGNANSQATLQQNIRNQTIVARLNAFREDGDRPRRAGTAAGGMPNDSKRRTSHDLAHDATGHSAGARPPSYMDPHAPPTHEERRNPTTAVRAHPTSHADTILAKAGLDPNDPRVRVLPDIVAGLHQVPRHRSIHVGGFVITAEPLRTVVPIEPASMPGRTVIQWERDDLDPVGLVKIDLLGLGMLTVIQDCLKYIRATRGRTIDLGQLDTNDQAVYDDLCAADTIGVFQVESRAQMNTLPRLKPRKFYDLVVEVALIRPGPIQGEMVHPYLRRRAELEKVEYPHPAVEPILKRTLGVPLFQEQGMQVAIVAAGFTPGEADKLRRAMGHKRSRERMAAICEKLVAGMAKNGIAEDVARRIYNQINAFADYGFPESHSASFALLVYASAYLRHHYAPEFTAAILNAQPMGFYSVGTLVEDAKRHGVEVRAVDLTRSAWDHTLELPNGTVVVPDDGEVRLWKVGAEGGGAWAKDTWMEGERPEGTGAERKEAMPEAADLSADVCYSSDPGDSGNLSDSDNVRVAVDAGDSEVGDVRLRRRSARGEAKGAQREVGDARRGAQNTRSSTPQRGAPPAKESTAETADPPHHPHATRTTSTQPDSPLAPAVRLGLRVVRGLGATAREKLERALQDGPFADIPDVVQRVGLDQRALRALAEAGAFDAMVPDVPPRDRRRVALWRVLEAVRGDAGPLAPSRPRPGRPPLPTMSRLETTDADYRLTGLSLNGHPMRHVRPLLEPNGVRTARDLHANGRDGERVAHAGLAICRQRPGTARGFVFLSLEDETGILNVVVTPKRFERQALMISTTPLLLVRGTLQVEQRVVNLRGEQFRPLRADAGETWAKGHDFH